MIASVIGRHAAQFVAKKASSLEHFHTKSWDGWTNQRQPAATSGQTGAVTRTQSFQHEVMQPRISSLKDPNHRLKASLNSKPAPSHSTLSPTQIDPVMMREPVMV